MNTSPHSGQSAPPGAGPQASDHLCLYLPAFSRLLPARRHRHHRAAARTVEEFTTQHITPLLTPAQAAEFHQQQTAEWWPWVVPNARGDRLEAAGCFIAVLWAMDTYAWHRDTARTVHAELTTVASHPATPWGRLLAATWRRLEAAMTARMRSRFTAGMDDFLASQITDAHARVGRTRQDFATALRLRCRTTGGPWVFPLLEHSTGIDVGHLLDTEVLLADALQAATEHGCLVNDLCSLRKELLDEDHSATLAALREHEGLSLQQAVDRVCAEITDRETTLLALRQEILANRAGARRDVKVYLDALLAFAAGNLNWSLTTTRYHGPGYHWPGHLPGWYTLHPHRAVFTPAASPDLSKPPADRRPR